MTNFFINDDNEIHWSSNIYDIADRYTHPLYGDIVVLKNKETYEPYSRKISMRSFHCI